MKLTKTFYTVTVTVVLLVSMLALWSGCTKKLSGTSVENQRPIVWFVNVPPEGAESSVNPIVNWVGQDQDGVIDYFRYMVVREDAAGQALGKPVDWRPTDDPLTEAEIQSYIDGFLMTMADTLWTYLYVDDETGNPQTSAIVPMQAEIDDPVRTLVPQFVFIQAFDESGLGSLVEARRFFRNDNPPDTELLRKFNVENSVFINSAIPTGSATGIRLRWQGADILDHPSEPPPFEFQWKVFGPYTDAEYAALLDSFQVPVFVSNDAQIFRYGIPPLEIIDSIVCDSLGVCDTFGYLLPTLYIVCDTTFENGMEVYECDTLVIDTISSSNVYGKVDTILRVFDDDFINSPEFNRVADSSNDGLGNVWVDDVADSLYNLYGNYPSDTSLEMNFLFWIRSRDDADVADLTPDYASLRVIEPKHERDIFVLDLRPATGSHRPFPDTTRQWFDRILQAWIQTRPNAADMEFDVTQDYASGGQYCCSEELKAKFLRAMLSYKVMIVYCDNIQMAVSWGEQNESTTLLPFVYTGLTADVNVWVIGRNLFHGTFDTEQYSVKQMSPSYAAFFGVSSTTFTGWGRSLFYDPANRSAIQDFTVALSIDPARWPDLPIDSANNRNRYVWLDTRPSGKADYFAAYYQPKNALPEVGWQSRTFETEVQYLYGSYYGESEHPSGAEYTLSGRPVAHRLNRGLFRTAHWKFSPMAMDEAQAQPVINSMMNWLYDGRNLFTGAKVSGAGAQHAVDPREISRQYWDAFYESRDYDEFLERLTQLNF